MATILDIGLLKNFTDIFVWILVFVIVYGGLEVTNLLKNRGLHALLAFAITAVVVITGGGSNLVVAMVPWVVVMITFFLFLLMVGQFIGLTPKQIVSAFGGSDLVGAAWYIAIPLIIILVVAWTQAPREQIVTDPNTGEQITVEAHQRAFVGVLTNPKVLGMILILSISAMTLTLMTGGRGAVVGGH